jgi:toluene monooxygenase system ferredoxin subunit
MGFARVCAESDISAGEMEAFFLDDWEVLVIRDRHGTLRALDGICPHEDFPLVHGSFDGAVLTCANHQWMFDVATGKGIRPPSCRLDQYALKVEDGSIFVDTSATPTDASS